MRTVKWIIFLVITTSLSYACQGQSNQKNSSEKKVSNVYVYYFHYTHRCATCLAVENETRKAIHELYGKAVSFASYNLDEKEGQEMAKKVGDVAGQALLVVSGNTKINLTMEGFMYARTNPTKLKQILKEKIDPLL